MPFSDLSDDILLEIALCIKEHTTWLGFAALNSRCRAAALSAWLAIGRKFIIIGDHHTSTVKALKEPTKELMNVIRKIHVSSSDIIETANKSKFGLSHLKNLIIGSTMLDTLRFSRASHQQFPLIIILNFLASLQTHPSVLPDTQLNLQIRVLKLREISCCFEDCSNISPIGLAGLEILHINWWRWSDTKERRSSVTACDVLAKMIKATRYTLQSLKIDLGDLEALRKFDIRMLAGNEDDVDAWKKLRKLRVSIDVDSRSQLSDLVGTMEVIADMFPNLEKLELITDVWAYDDMIRYTPDILEPLSKLKSLHHLHLALDFERDSKDELHEDHDFKWYNRCLHRRYAATQAIANVCPITRCYWLHKDSEVNEQPYRFIIENESAAGRPGASDPSRSEGQTGSRVVKAKKSWWMEPDWDGSVIEDLPCEAVGTSAEDYATSDSDESVSRR